MAPFRSIAEAIEAAQDEDTILVQRGTFALPHAIVINKPGVRLIGITGERPVLVAEDSHAAAIIVTADRVLLQDLVLQGGFYGVKLDLDRGRPTRGITIRSCRIGATAADCIKSTFADDLTIESCQIGPSGSTQRDNAEGIDIIGSIGVVVRGCTIEDTATNGVYLKGGTRNGLVERCLVRRTGHGGILLGQTTSLEYMRDSVEHEAIDCIARNNVISDTATAALGTYSGRNVGFVSNTLINVANSGQAALWVVTNGRGVSAEGVTFRNNIVIVGGDRPALFVKDSVGFPQCDHNLYFARGEGARFVREMSAEPSLDRRWTFDQWQAAAGMDQHSTEGDPQLEERRFRPGRQSPALGAGEPIVGVLDDYFGARRKSVWDIGAVIADQEVVK